MLLNVTNIFKTVNKVNNGRLFIFFKYLNFEF